MNDTPKEDTSGILPSAGGQGSNAEVQAEVQVAFPFHLDGRGRVASPSYPEHVEQLIEQVLFTSPGERVNRPEFGCGLLETLFSSISQEEVAALEFLVQGSLERWLGDVLRVESVTLTVPRETELEVRVGYVLRRRRQRRTAVFRQSATGSRT